MQLKQNAVVSSRDGKRFGRIGRVVLDPETKHVTHLVVRQGALFAPQKVVPMNMVEQDAGDGVTLRARADDLAGLQDFEVERIVPTFSNSPGAGPLDVAPDYWQTPLGGGPPLPARVSPPARTTVEQNIPEGAVALKEGAKVVAADDRPVGVVERILADPRQELATHLIVSQGLIVKQRRLIPIAWVGEIAEGEIHLIVTSYAVDDLGYLPEEV
jgi:sporulation protein YlmC with PRC-barrel domain